MKQANNLNFSEEGGEDPRDKKETLWYSRQERMPLMKVKFRVHRLEL
jgi:hypothetical protein